MSDLIPEIPAHPRGFWGNTFGATQAACLVGGLFATGVALQLTLNGRGVPGPVWPVSGALLAVFTVAIVVAAWLAGRSALLSALSEVPVTLACFAGIGALGVIAGTVPQTPPAEPGLAARLGAHAVTTSWPFVLLLLLLLTNLGIALVRRLIPWRAGSARFALGHLGLWLALAVGTFGAGDIERVRLTVHEGAATDFGTTTDGAVRYLPFGLRLIDFRLEEYPPAITFLDTDTGAMLWQKGEARIEAAPGVSGTWKHLTVSIDRFVPRAVRLDGDDYAPGVNPDAPGAAHITVRDAATGAETRGWIVGGAIETLPRSLVAGKVAVTLAKPRPKAFQSEAEFITPGDAPRRELVEVNRPVAVAGWRVYQLGYDDKRGPGSDFATFEAIRDPWLPGVYAGVFLLIAGAFGMIFGGAKALYDNK